MEKDGRKHLPRHKFLVTALVTQTTVHHVLHHPFTTTRRLNTAVITRAEKKHKK